MTKTHLAPCATCVRHVRVSEAACPFCGATLDAAVRSSAPRQGPTARLSRAALLAFGTLGTGTLGAGALALEPGCSSSSAGTVGTAVPYGLAPIPDGGEESDGTINVAPPYGISPQPDASDEADGTSGFGVDAADGGPRLDSDASDAGDAADAADASDGHVTFLPPYGIAPPPPPDPDGGDASN
jgi:hypothetical protein